MKCPALHHFTVSTSIPSFIVTIQLIVLVLYVNTVSTILAMSLVSSNIAGFTKKATASVRQIPNPPYLNCNISLILPLGNGVHRLLRRAILRSSILQIQRSSTLHHSFQRNLRNCHHHDCPTDYSRVCFLPSLERNGTSLVR